MNRIKFRFIIVFVFVFLFACLLITNTYALFETNTDGNGNFEIAKWVILVNDTDITQTKTLSLNDLTYLNGTHTESGYFAPGSSAYFDLEIDATDSDVSIEYLLNIDDTLFEDYPNIVFRVTNLDTDITTTTNSYNGLIRLNDQNRVIRLRINLVWLNQEEYDVSDTTLIDGELKFTITANFKQYISE